MSPKLPKRNTPYAQYVYSNLPSIVESGAGLYSYSELAGMVGLKPTGNFRKRIKALVSDGKLNAVAVFTPRGGIETRFQSPVEQKSMGIPF